MRHLILSTLALVLTAGQGFGAAFNAPITGGSGSGGLTNGYSFASPLVTQNETNISLPDQLVTLNAQYTNVVSINTASNITLTLSNLANNTKLIVTPGSFTVTPSILNSNLDAGSMFQGAKLYNKTNLTLEGSWGQSILDGSGGLGEVLFVSNCFNLTFKGLTFRGMTNHNINAMPDYSAYLWAGVNVYASARIRFENCTFERHADHGLQDKGAEANSVGSSTIISTNMIEVINCYFTDIGGFRTNSGDGTIRGDGTAIVPTGWTIEGNTFQNCQRGIEPYDTADADGRLFHNCIMRNNKFYNMVEFAISPAGSTNGHNAQVVGNTLINDPSFNYHGTNWGSGGIPHMCQGFMLNGGRGWVVKDNYAKGGMYIGYSMISSATLDDFTLEGNTADFINRGDSLGYGFWIGNSVNSAANASSVRRLNMRGNKTFKTYDSGILVLAARDSVVDGNTVSTILRTNIGVSSSAFQFGAASMGSSIITNLTIQNNVAINGNNDAAQPMDVAFGYAFAANLSNVKSINNHAFDFDIAAYTNLAGDNVRIENSTAADTNRVVRVRDLNGLLVQGANMTLTPAADGSVTFAGSAGGSGGTNFPPVISATTNVTVGTGVRQEISFLNSPSNQFQNFQGTALNGEVITGTHTNSGTTNALRSFNVNGSASSYWDYRVASNVTSFVVPAGSMVKMTWKYSTNNGARWEVGEVNQLEYELAFEAGITTRTNGSTVTLRSGAAYYNNAAENTFGTAAEVTNLVYTIPGGALSTNRVLRFHISGYETNYAAGRSITIKAYLGSTTVSHLVSASWSNPSTNGMYFIDGFLVNNNSASAQTLLAKFQQTETSVATVGFGRINTDEQVSVGGFGGTAAEDTSTDKEFIITIAASNTDIKLFKRLSYAVIE